METKTTHKIISKVKKKVKTINRQKMEHKLLITTLKYIKSGQNYQYKKTLTKKIVKVS